MAAMASEQGNILVAGRYCGVQRIWSTTIINGIAVLKVFLYTWSYVCIVQCS